MSSKRLKINSFSIPLFNECYKAYPSSYPNSSAYLLIKNQELSPQQLYENLNRSYICPILTDKNIDKSVFIVLEGQCLHNYVLSKKNDLDNQIFYQDQIWVLIACICEAFAALKANNCANKITHLRQYSIRKIGIVYRFKLLYHQSMVSQLQSAESGSCKWDDLYLSPQELNGQFVPQKSIIFSFGLILLNLCAHSDRSRSIYKTDAFQIDQKIIKSKLSIAYKKYGYSKLLCKFISKCLRANYLQRFQFTQLKNHLVSLIQGGQIKNNQILKSIITNQPLFQFKSKDNFEQQQIQTQRKVPQKLNFYNLIRKNSNSRKSLVDKKKQQDLKTRRKRKRNSSPQKKQRVFSLQQLQKQEQLSKKLMRLTQISTKNTSRQNTSRQNLLFTKIGEKDSKCKKDSEDRDDGDIAQSGCVYRGTFGPKRKASQQNSQIIKQIKHVRRSNQKYASQQAIGSQLESQTYEDVEIREQHSSQFIEQSPKIANKIESKIQFGKLSSQIQPVSRGEQAENRHEQNGNPQSRRKYSYQSNEWKTKTIPQILKQVQNFKLQNCLKSIEQLIRRISRAGVWIQGDVYYGDFQHGKRSGLGLQIYSNGEYYYGNFQADLYHGPGFYYWNQSEYFFGKFYCGQKIWGRLQGQTKYQGQFYNNKRHGSGVCWYSTGEVYSGGWENGKRHGQGYILQPSGSRFVGNWVKGNRRGEGYLETKSLRIAGFWNGQMIDGDSLIQYKNGDVFKGKTGQLLEKVNGEYISHSGRIFKGVFQNDEPKEGILLYSNGDKYIGQLNKLKRHGYGEYYYKSGQVYKGLWNKNCRSLESQ